MKHWKSILFAAAGLSLASCSEEPTQVGGQNQVKPEEKKVTLYTWENYFDPEVWEQFTEETGIELEVLFYESTEELVANMQSKPQSYDVLITDDITVSHLQELALLRKLDHSKIPNFKNVDPNFVDLKFDKKNTFSAPYMWGSTLVAYRSDKISDPDHSWSILWDPAYKGRVMMLDEAQDIFGVTLLKNGLSADAEDAESIESAKQQVLKQIRDVDVTFGELDDVLDALETGETWVAMSYSGDVAAMIEDTPEVDYFIPREGALLWLDNFVISRDSENVGNAHKLINFMMKAEVAAANSNFVWYASPNKAAEPLLDDELVNDTRIYPTPEVMEKCQFPTPAIQAKRQNLLNLAMRDIRKLRREQDKPAKAIEVSSAE